MNVRTREATVTFDHAFHLGAADGDLPAGTYRLVIDEEQLLGVSSLAYRRIATMLHTPALAAPPGRSQCLSVNAAELDAALLKDQQTSAREREAPAGDASPSTDVPHTGSFHAPSVSQR